MEITKLQLQNLITHKAGELGFVKTGFARFEPLEKESRFLKEWIDKGYDADMKWIEKGLEKRKNIRNILSSAESVISFAYNYFTPFYHQKNIPKISRYAWGKDYHKILKPKLKELCKILRDAGFSAVAYVDDGPVMDKVWAVKAGIGWIGKNTNLINTEFGSWIFLCEIITDAEFEKYDSPVEDMCGECNLCISACPTGALVEEYVIDAYKCISYQTIENRGDIPDEINLDGWIFGCDVCQEICPYNLPKFNLNTTESSFYPIVIELGEDKKPLNEIDISDLEAITEENFKVIFSDSPLKRAKYKGLMRNIKKVKSSA
ncbi:MAG: tRNA epoxyqueuosine(34) reductase QueG [Ignavibacteria bacterium]|nr:tRNA epoxyqueuosine(34) reductase QueG [Ignavibacteria bacterium]